MTPEIVSPAAPRRAAPPTHMEANAQDVPTVVRASVCAGGNTTPYLRAGTGDVVVLLGESFLSPIPDPLLTALAKAHRVVVPDLPHASSSETRPAQAFSSWLRSFLDGLGAAEVSVVARDNLALSALTFALTDAGRTTRLVLSFRDAPDPLDDRDTLNERLEEAQCRLLIVREPPEPNDRQPLREAITRFLAA